MKLQVRTIAEERLCRFAALLLLGGGIASAQISARPLTGQEALTAHARIKPSLVAGITGPLLFQDKQGFEVSGAGFISFTMLPVRFYSRTDWGGTVYRCGVVFLPAQQSPVFLRTVGYDWTEVEQCEGIKGVGFVDGGGKMPPRIVLLWDAASPNASVNEPMVLDWNAGANRYVGNATISQRLENDLKTFTIAAIKQQLKLYAVEPAK
ncbi:hypothetical protein [Granulicella tundricola]|uniref:Uncharacterized protein n=1 Tax=Granulicella tundricola (strain ATCC BAA-1859 / DSM 23138 / MP5ACTX9) TaxID=1198114 RepID=E8WYC2_GRATM|nr:hypothetical protein [Granulicella tundricola]ADW69828.1 hypothetical protein AciX9_2805 [Granulicella tundricola MP5ACTX9]